MRHLSHVVRSTSLFAILLAAPAAAQGQEMNAGDSSAQPQGQAEQQPAGNGASVDILRNWGYAQVYEQGMSVERLIEQADVFGHNGDEIGNVENLIFADNGEVVALIAEVGGFWDIGDTHVAVPWDQVDIGADVDRVVVPVTEANADQYTIFGPASLITAETGSVATVDDDVMTGENSFKSTDLIGEYIYLQDGERYGYLADLVIDENRISAIVVDTAAFGTPGYRAYPYRDGIYGTPTARGYRLPLNPEQAGTIENFDYDRLNADS